MKSLTVLSVLMAVLFGLTVGVCAGAVDESFSASVSTEGLPFPCVAGAPCKVMISLNNTTGDVLALSNWSVSAKPGSGVTVDVKLDEGTPADVKPGETATAGATVTLPESAGGKVITLVCSVQAGSKLRTVNLDVPVTPQYEITLLPTRLILGPGSEAKTLGVSVINHTEQPFEGTIKFTSQPGISMTPAEISSKIDPLGLEPYMLSVKPVGNPAPGHYTMWMDVAGKARDWAMIDVPAVAKKSTVKIDGKLDEWQAAQSVSIRATAEGNAVNTNKARFAYDAKNLYVAVEVDDAHHDLSSDSKSRAHANPPSDTIVIGIDPLINGAKTAKGGYRDDDKEFTLAGAEGGSVVLRTAIGSKATEQDAKLPISFRREGNKSIYEAAIPWTEFKAFKPAKNKMIAVSVLVNDSDGKSIKTYSFGGGIGAGIDPRLFVPVVLSN